MEGLCEGLYEKMGPRGSHFLYKTTKRKLGRKQHRTTKRRA